MIQIHWHEGLFLQPHHLQVLQRAYLERGRDDRKTSWYYPYGLIEMSVSQEELQNGYVRIDRLKAIMPSGQEINVPETTDLPILNIEAALAKRNSFTISLAVPLWQKARANAFPIGQPADSRSKLLFRPKEMDCPDENAGDNRRPLLVRRTNARLILDNEDESEMETIPLIRMRRGVSESEGKARLDPEYVPPCLITGASSQLGELVRDLVASVISSREAVQRKIKQSGYNVEVLRGVQIKMMMRLQILARYSASLPELVKVRQVPPIEVFIAFRELLASLDALSPERDPVELASYQHDDPYTCFRHVADRLNRCLVEQAEENVLKVPFQDAGGYRVADLGLEHLNKPNAWYLAVVTKSDPVLVSELVCNRDRFRLLPLSRRKIRVFGIPMQEVRFAPLQLPALPNQIYFKLDTTGNKTLWENIKQERKMTFDYDGNVQLLADASFTLIMTVPVEKTQDEESRP